MILHYSEFHRFGMIKLIVVMLTFLNELMLYEVMVELIIIMNVIKKVLNFLIKYV
jgi:hypothetical protein